MELNTKSLENLEKVRLSNFKLIAFITKTSYGKCNKKGKFRIFRKENEEYAPPTWFNMFHTRDKIADKLAKAYDNVVEKHFANTL